MEVNISNYLAELTNGKGDDVAIAYRRNLRLARWSYASLISAIFQFAGELEARGVARGDRAIICGENCPEWVIAFYGCILQGVVVVPLDTQSTPDFVARICEQVRPVLFIRGMTSGGIAPALPTFILEEMSETIAGRPVKPRPAQDIKATDTAEIIFTSGTTVAPKGVLLTHQNIIANLEPIEAEIKKYIKWERFVHPLRFLCLPPLSHVFGQFMGLFVPPLLSAEVMFLNSLNPTQIIRTVKQERISVIATVPRVLQLLREKVERDFTARGELEELYRQLDAAAHWSWLTRWWRFRGVHQQFGWKCLAFVTGGAPLDAETERFWRRLGFAVTQGYGMTETAALVSVNSPFRTTEGSTGRVLPGQELKLDESGEILVRGRNITPGYWGAQTEKDANGWFHTGDIGAMDASGNLFLKGRTKDVIVTAAGMKIFPEDLEAALNRQPEVRASAVVGIEGERGQEPVAALILRHERVNPDEVIRRANQTLAEHQQIRRWLLWPEPDFPRTTTQKIRKLPVVDFIRMRHREDPVAMKTPQALADVITRVSGQVPANTTPEANLGNDLKLDSLARVELISLIEERYRINIDESAFTAMTTVGDIERLVRSESRDDAETQQHTYPRWAQRLPVRWIRVLIYYLFLLPLTKLLCWTHTSGRDKVAAMKEPALFVTNHVTAVDAALIMSALPGRFRRKLTIAMSGEMLNEYLHPPEGTPMLARVRLRMQYLLIVSLFNVFPLPRKSGFRTSFAYAGEAMDRGYSVLVFPEGERTQDGLMHTFQSGIGILATGLEAPVVPIKISGLYELKILHRHFAPPGTVKVAFGDPVKFKADRNPLEIAQELQKRVASL